MHGIIYAHKWFLYVSESTYIICIVNMCSNLMTTEKNGAGFCLNSQNANIADLQT